MTSLSTGEKEFMEIFRHFKTVAEIGIMIQNVIAVQNNYMSTPNIKDLQNILNSLKSKGFIKEGNNNFIILTQIGEEYLYGQFDIQEGLKEFMAIFKHFRSTKGEGIMGQNILAVKDKMLAPINNKNLKAIIDYAVENKYVEEKDDNFLILTEKGEKYIY